MFSSAVVFYSCKRHVSTSIVNGVSHNKQLQNEFGLFSRVVGELFISIAWGAFLILTSHFAMKIPTDIWFSFHSTLL
jgi:hypothetical protein